MGTIRMTNLEGVPEMHKVGTTEPHPEEAIQAIVS